MPSTTTIASLAVITAGALGAVYYTNPALLGVVPAPVVAKVEPTKPAVTPPPLAAPVTPAAAPAPTAAPVTPTAAPVTPTAAPVTPPATPMQTTSTQATAATTPPPGATKSPAAASVPAEWIGLPVISADGTTVGQVKSLKPHADGRSTVLEVQGTDGKSYDISSAIAAMQGRAVQLNATAAEVGKMVR